MNALNDLKTLMNNNPNMTNFGRSLLLSRPDIHQWVMSNPEGFVDASFNERLYALMHSLNARPICPITNKERRFVNYTVGYKLSLDDTLDEKVFHEDAPSYLNSVRTFAVKFPQHYNKLMQMNFGDASFSERLYCYTNDIKERPSIAFMNFHKGYVKKSRTDIKSDLIEYANKVGSNDAVIGTKIKKFLKTNRARNNELYELADDRENIDFVVCPILGIRTLNIKKMYIEGILLMSVEEFKQKFPNQKLSCSGHSKTISSGLHIEIEPGVTKHAFGVKKGTVARREIGDDGLTGNQKIGIATKAAHMKLDENGLNGYQKIANKRNDTILDNGLSVQQNALRKRIDKQLIKGENGRMVGASEISKRVLQPIIDILVRNDIKFYFDRNEYGIKYENNYYFYDLVIPSFELCVEFQGANFHPNPEADWNKWKQSFSNLSAEEVASYDQLKAIALWKSRHIASWFIYEKNAKEQVDCLIDYILESYEVQ